MHSTFINWRVPDYYETPNAECPQQLVHITAAGMQSLPIAEAICMNHQQCKELNVLEYRKWTTAPPAIFLDFEAPGYEAR